MLDLSEPPENGLGYGRSGRSGSSRPHEVRDRILRTAKEIVVLGSRDPEMISLMGFLEENVGPDTISDFTTRTILFQLGTLTETFADGLALQLRRWEKATPLLCRRFERGGLSASLSSCLMTSSDTYLSPTIGQRLRPLSQQARGSETE
ncbi:MAG: hypothetical protein ABL879_09295 [Devosia sp.]